MLQGDNQPPDAGNGACAILCNSCLHEVRKNNFTLTSSAFEKLLIISRAAGTLEVLYEDPKEDSISILSSDEIAASSASGAAASMPALSQRCHGDQDDLDRRRDTLRSWQRLEGEIRDLHELITEFSGFVVNVGVRIYKI